MKMNRRFHRLAVATAVLTFIVVVVGAYVRLADAGLGCPDWPGCYGYMLVTEALADRESASAAYPERPLDAAKVWKEMAHRYLAGILGLAIAVLGWLAWRQRHEPGQPVALPLALVGLVIFQSLLGMWTVTLLLKPAVVVAHLLGGLLTLALVWWLALRTGGHLRPPMGTLPRLKPLRPWIWLGSAVLVAQVFLGGWVSANYAALACPDLPQCQGAWWPPMDLREGFTLWRDVGVDYEGGILTNEARVAIHHMHRLGAVVATIVLGAVAFVAIRRGGHTPAAGIGVTLAVLLVIQLGLGIANVLLSLPLSVAVAHNGVAALLVATMVTLYHVVKPPNPITP